MTSILDYLNNMNENDREVMEALRKTILTHLPKGFEEQLSYGMIGYVVPHSVYPKGYHCDPKLPLPFMAIARQKHSFNFYHMGLYGDPVLFDAFKADYEKRFGRLDHGKSCLRFKTKEKIPFDLIGTLVEKSSAKDYIQHYEATLVKTRK